MHIYNAVMLGSLLLSGLAPNSPTVEYQANKLLQLDSVQQQIFTPTANQESECPRNGKNPMPGCGRRDT
jgi:hypothetical protein